MIKRCTTMLIAIALVFTMALAAFAQAAPKPQRQAKQKPGKEQKQAVAKASAQEMRGMFANLQRIIMPPSPREFEKIGMALNLTEDQKTQVKGLYQSFGTVARQLLPQRAAAVKAFMQVMAQPAPNKGDLQSASSKVDQLDQALMSAEFDFWIGLKGILNPQQQQQVQSYMQQRAEREAGGPKPIPTTQSPSQPK